MPRLTPKQSRFVDEYLIDLNGSAAAARAGFSTKSAKHIAHHLLGKPHVAEAVLAGRAELAKRAEVEKERIVVELANIAFANMLDFIQIAPDGNLTRDYSSLTRDQAAALRN